MAYLIDLCSSCGKQVNMYVSQTFIGGRVDWHASYFCGECGNLTEMDWLGEKPEDRIVKAIEEQDGKWILYIKSKDKDRVIILKTLRNDLCLPMDKVREILRNFDNLQLNGTRAEMEKMASSFSKAGVITRIERIE